MSFSSTFQHFSGMSFRAGEGNLSGEKNCLFLVDDDGFWVGRLRERAQ